jgi:hypothetical protein
LVYQLALLKNPLSVHNHLASRLPPSAH